jgi:hypothetical protein
MSDQPLTPEMIAQFDLGPDPYPDLPLMAPDALQDGDVLMMLGQGSYKHIPVSWLIRALDGGAYSHSAVVSLIDGAPHVWDHGNQDMELVPRSLEEGIREHAWCHVYRLTKHGESVGSARYPSAPIVQVLEAHRGDPYDMTLLIMAGVVAVISRQPEDPDLRELARLGLEALIWAIGWWLDHKDLRKGMLICTGVTGLSYWDASKGTPHDYALEVDIQRRGPTQPDEDWDEAIGRLKALVARAVPEFPEDQARLQKALASNARWVEVGGPSLPVNMVSPSDLEFSRTLKRVGRLEIPS